MFLQSAKPLQFGNASAKHWNAKESGVSSYQVDGWNKYWTNYIGGERPVFLQLQICHFKGESVDKQRSNSLELKKQKNDILKYVLLKFL